MEKEILIIMGMALMILIASNILAQSMNMLDYAVMIESQGFQEATMKFGKEFLTQEMMKNPEMSKAMPMIYTWAFNPETVLTDYLNENLKKFFPEEFGQFQKLEGVYAMAANPEAMLKERIQAEIMQGLSPGQKDLLSKAQRLKSVFMMSKGLELKSNIQLDRMGEVEKAELSYNREAEQVNIGYIFAEQASFARITKAGDGCKIENLEDMTRIHISRGCEFEINSSIFKNLEKGLLEYNRTMLVRAGLMTDDQCGEYLLGMEQYHIPAGTAALWVWGPPAMLEFPDGLKVNDRIKIAQFERNRYAPKATITMLENGDLEIQQMPFQGTKIIGKPEFEMSTSYGRMMVKGKDENAGILFQDQNNFITSPGTMVKIMNEDNNGFMVETEDENLRLAHCQDISGKDENFLGFCMREGRFYHEAKGSGFRLSMIEDMYQPEPEKLIVPSGIGSMYGIEQDYLCEVNGIDDCESALKARNLLVPGTSYLFNGMSLEQEENFERIAVEEEGEGRIYEEDGAVLDLGEELTIPVEDEGLALGEPSESDFQGILCTETDCYSKSGNRFGYCGEAHYPAWTGKASSVPRKEMMKEIEQEWEREEGCKDVVYVSKEKEEEVEKEAIIGGGEFDGARVVLQGGWAFLYKKGSEEPKLLEWDEERGRIYLPDQSYLTEDQFNQVPKSPEELKREAERRKRNLDKRYDELGLGMLDKWQYNRYIQAIKDDQCIVAMPDVLCPEDLRKILEEKGIKEGKDY
jgi:hypothetical protein